MSTPTEAEKRRAQNRENLRAHYGLNRTSSQTSASGSVRRGAQVTGFTSQREPNSGQLDIGLCLVSCLFKFQHVVSNAMSQSLRLGLLLSSRLLHPSRIYIVTATIDGRIGKADDGYVLPFAHLICEQISPHHKMVPQRQRI